MPGEGRQPASTTTHRQPPNPWLGSDEGQWRNDGTWAMGYFQEVETSCTYCDSQACRVRMHFAEGLELRYCTHRCRHANSN
eukprot:6312004-Amphidinium_carterae.2